MTVDFLQQHLPEGSFEAAPSADGMPTIYVPVDRLVETLSVLKESLGFGFLADIVGVDYYPREPRFEVLYMMATLGTAGYGDAPRRLRVKVRVHGEDPTLPTISHLWKMADWAERELWDMLGIRIEGHQDLRRILMPEDWEGFPARRDYPVQIKQPVKTYEPLQVSEEEFLANIEASRDRSRKH